MAPKNKRASSLVVAKEESKKPRIDPKLAPVTSAISKVEHLPERCKQMLIMMLGPSLKVGSLAERHDIQIAGLRMIEETLEQEKSRIQALVSDSEQNLETLNSVKAEKDGEKVAAEALLAARKDEEQIAKTSLAEITQAKRSAEKALAEAQEAKSEGGKLLEANKQEKELLEKAFLDHYKTPMDADEGPHFTALQPLLPKLNIEQSLLSALPSSCVKLKDQRGSFDIVVIEELQKAFTTKIAELGSMLEAEGPAAIERDSKVQAAEADLETKKATLLEAGSAYDAAQTAVKEADQEATNATKAALSASVDVQTAEKACQAFKLQLSDFEGGPLASFTSLKEPPKEELLQKVEAAEEVATAGA